MYKIARSCLPGRLKSATSTDKCRAEGIFKWRYIAENIRFLCDTLLYATKHHVPALLLVVGFEDSDSVALSFTEQLLFLTLDMTSKEGF